MYIKIHYINTVTETVILSPVPHQDVAWEISVSGKQHSFRGKPCWTYNFTELQCMANCVIIIVSCNNILRTISMSWDITNIEKV